MAEHNNKKVRELIKKDKLSYPLPPAKNLPDSKKIKQVSTPVSSNR
jgi:hypothetical protein